jgi:hypothetical protein
MDDSAPGVVRRFSPLKVPNWDELLTSRPDFSFFHGTAWLKVLVESYGFSPEFFCLGPVGKADAVLPLVETDSWLRGRRAVALPFTDDCPPLVRDGETFNKLFLAAVDQGKSRGWRSIELRGGRELFAEPVPASLSFYAHEVELFADEKVMFDRLDGSMRQAVRKAVKEGVKVGFFQTTEALEVFYRLQCLTRKRHGLPPQPYAFFMNIHRHILSKELGTIAIAEHQGGKIAASVYFFMGGRAIYKYGASDFSRQNLRGPNLVMWEAMKWLANRGIKSLHLGKTSQANEGLRRFKLNLGAQEKVVDYVKFDLRSGDFMTENDAITGWHNEVFRRMPGFLARTAGGLLYKHWA